MSVHSIIDQVAKAADANVDANEKEAEGIAQTREVLWREFRALRPTVASEWQARARANHTAEVCSIESTRRPTRAAPPQGRIRRRTSRDWRGLSGETKFRTAATPKRSLKRQRLRRPTCLIRSRLPMETERHPQWAGEPVTRTAFGAGVSSRSRSILATSSRRTTRGALGPATPSS